MKKLASRPSLASKKSEITSYSDYSPPAYKYIFYLEECFD